jgi:hypothetical protein
VGGLESRKEWPGGPEKPMSVRMVDPAAARGESPSGGKDAGAGKRWPDGRWRCRWLAAPAQSAKQAVGQQLRQLWQLRAQPARSSQSTPPRTWCARRQDRMRVRVQRRPPEGRRVPSSAGLDGRLGSQMAWRAGGRSRSAAAERSTQSARRREAPTRMSYQLG